LENNGKQQPLKEPVSEAWEARNKNPKTLELRMKAGPPHQALIRK
jgi:hypothetical protein